VGLGSVGPRGAHKIFAKAVSQESFTFSGRAWTVDPRASLPVCAAPGTDKRNNTNPTHRNLGDMIYFVIIFQKTAKVIDFPCLQKDFVSCFP
jgi:hypothetical protein